MKATVFEEVLDECDIRLGLGLRGGCMDPVYDRHKVMSETLHAGADTTVLLTKLGRNTHDTRECRM